MQTKLVLKQRSSLKLRFQPGATGPAGTITVGTVTTGAPGSDVVVTNVGTAEDAILDFTIPEGDQGIKGETGDKGWTPELAVVTDGARRVQQVVDWLGGEGTKPATGDYVGATGLTPTIGDAVDIRGPAGTATIPDGDKGDITTSASGDAWTINAGAVDLAKIQAIATSRLLGRATAGPGDVEQMTPAQARFILQITAQGEAIIMAADAATQRAAMGAGTGDAVGPASSGNNNIALFDGTTGKLLKDAAVGLVGAGRLKQISIGTHASATTTTSTSYAATSLQVSLTPQSTGNRILLFAMVPVRVNESSSAADGRARIQRSAPSAKTEAEGPWGVAVGGATSVFLDGTMTLIGYATPASTDLHTYVWEQRVVASGDNLTSFVGNYAGYLVALEITP